MAKIELNKVREHNLGLAKTGIPGNTCAKEDIKDTMHEDMDRFAKTMAAVRSPNRTNKQGKKIAQSHASFSEFLTDRYGIYRPEGNTDKMYVVSEYLKQMGVQSSSFSLKDMAELFKVDLNKGMLEATLLNTDVVNGTTWIIREVFLEAIRLGMLGVSHYQNWIGRSLPMADIIATAPQIRKGEGTAKFLNEGETIPMGMVKFGQKRVTVQKVGVGFEITDELMFRSSIDMMAEGLMAVGEDMSLSKDVLALDTLKNGEQGDLSENAPVIGVDNTTNGVAWGDILRTTARMKQLGHNPDGTISNEAEALAIAQLPEFKGFNGVTVLSTLNAMNSILGAIPKFQHSIHGNMAAQTFMFLDPRRAMFELKYRSMMTERERDPEKQKDLIYVSDWVGFMINRRDARVIVKGDLLYNGTPGQTGAFPTYMDIASYVNNPFKS